MTALDRVLQALQERGSRGRGSSWQCPAHEDRSPSLSVKRGTKAKGVVLTCHAGCATEDVVQALGLNKADLFDEPLERSDRPAPAPHRSQVVAQYPYSDENGELLFIVKRIEPGYNGEKKTFRQFRPDGTTGIIGIRRVLYRLPDVIAAAKAGGTITICEGEKDADRLVQEGLIATTCPMGAGKWSDEFTEALCGSAEVVVIADRDEAGRRHARQVAHAVKAAGVAVRVMEPATGKDASDHLDAGKGLAEFTDVTEQLMTGPAPIDDQSAPAASVSPPLVPVDGAELLAEVEAFHRRFNVLPSEHAYVAVALWDAHAHLIDCFDSTPRLAALSPEPGSGKTRLLEIVGTLVPRPMAAVNCTSAALFRAVSDLDGRPTVLFDEIDTIFGPKARENEDLRGLINAGHRRSGVAYRCVGEGTKQIVKEFPAYAPVALAGLGGLPDTILARSVVIAMRRRAPGEQVEPFRERLHEPQGHAIRDRLAAWALQVAPKMGEVWPELPASVQDREADKWEPLIAIADAAGGDWPARSRAAAEWFVKEASRLDKVSLGVRLLLDIKTVFDLVGADRISTVKLLDELLKLDDAPWPSLLKGEAIDARYLSRTLHRYDNGAGEPIGPKPIRDEFGVFKGYAKGDFWDAWQRYAPTPTRETEGEPLAVPSPPSQQSVTPVAPVTPQVSVLFPESDL